MNPYEPPPTPEQQEQSEHDPVDLRGSPMDPPPDSVPLGLGCTILVLGAITAVVIWAIMGVAEWAEGMAEF